MSKIKANLSDQVALMRLVVQALPDPALLVSIRGQIGHCNNAAAVLLGYSPSDLCNKPIETVFESGQFAQIPIYRPSDGKPTDLANAPTPESCICIHPQNGVVKLLASGVLLTEIDQVVLFIRTPPSTADSTTRQLQYIIENSEEAIFLIDEDLSITSWNRGASNTYFYSSAESFGKPVQELFPREERQQVEKLFSSVREGFSINQFECTHLRNGGASFEASISITPYFDASGEAKGFCLMSRDISLRRQAEKRLQESEERFRQLAENITEVFWLRTANEMLYISPGYEKTFGRSCVSLYRDPNSFLEHIHPDDRDYILSKIFVNGEFLNGPFDEEYRIIKPDGEIRWIRARSFPVRGNYEIPRSTGIAEDITSRKKVEEALRISETNLSRAQQIARLGYWHWDVLANEATWSDETYSIFERERASFKPSFESYSQHIHPDDRAWAVSRVQTIMERGESFSFTHRIVTPTGKVKYIKTYGEVSRGLDGKPEHLFGIALDITEQTLAETSLRDSEERFRNVFEQNTLGMALLNLNGSFTRVNQVLCEMLGYTLHEFLDLTLDQVCIINDANKGMLKLDCLLSGDKDGCSCETKCIKKDGSHVHTQINAACIRNAVGDAQHVVLQVQDISERQRTLQLLHRSQETLALAESLAHLGNWDWEVSTNEVIWSDETYRIFGLDPKTFKPNLYSVLSRLHPEDKDDLATALMRAVDHKEQIDIVFRLIRPDGDIRFVHGNGIQLEENGKTIRVVGSVLDITERKRMEDELRFSEERLKLLSDSTSEGVVIHEHGLVVDCNSAVERMFGKPLKDVVGNPATDLIHPEDRHIANERIAKRLSGTYEVRGIRPDGIEFPMLVTALETISKNTPIRVVLFQDITDRKAVEEARQQASTREAELQMLKKAAATYAHEINNPLTGIQATMQILQDHPLPSEDAELITEAINAARRISNVIDSMQRLKDPHFKPYLDREILDIEKIGNEPTSN